MTKWLASVQSLEEAKSLEQTMPNILDLKDPATGALGALPQTTVKSVVAWVGGRCQTSATVGNLEMKSELIAAAITNMAASGVDYVKVGLFAESGLMSCLFNLQTTLQQSKTPVIAVLFADLGADLSLISAVKQAGFRGVMLDTANKNGQGLLDHWQVADLKNFISEAHGFRLICGLAGGLAIEDIDTLKTLGADYLGFRSALCEQRQRTFKLQPERALAIQAHLLS